METKTGTYSAQHARVPFAYVTPPCQREEPKSPHARCGATPTRRCSGCGAVRCREHYFNPEVISLAGQCAGCCEGYTGD